MKTQIHSIIIFISFISVLGFMFKPVRDLLALKLESLKTICTPWQFLSYGLIHRDLKHLIYNMLSFWVFSGLMLKTHSIYQIVLVLLAGIIVPAIFGYLMIFFRPQSLSVMGASGGCYAVMGVALMTNPEKVFSFFGFSMIGVHILLIILAYDFISSKLSGKDDTWHFGHMLGLVAGLMCIQFLAHPASYPVLNILKQVPIPADFAWLQNLGKNAYNVTQIVSNQLISLFQS